MSFEWTPGPPQLHEEPAAPSTQPSVEDTAPAGAAPAQTAPAEEATVAERIDTAEAAYTPPAAEDAPTAVAANAEAETQASAPPSPEPVDEPPRPRRTGWWQRAKASIVGD